MKKVLISFTFALIASAIVANAQEVQLPALKKSVTWENIKINPAPLPILGHIVATPSDITKESFWSVGCETLDRDYSNFENYKQYVGQTGVGYARLQSGWAKTETEKGKYNFEWLDKHVDGLIAQGVKPWICLCYGNPVYSDDGYDLNAKIIKEGKVMDAWERYVKAIVKRYKGKVTMWEVWNEPDGGKNGKSYYEYAALFHHTAKAIRSVDKDVKIAAFGVCTPAKREYLSKALDRINELGSIKDVNYVTYHAYSPIPEYIVPEVERFRGSLEKYPAKIEVLQGETGCPGQLEYGHAMNGIEWNEYSQVKWDLRQMMNHFALGVPYSVFTMVDLNYGWMHQSFGLIRMNLQHVPIYLRPKFYAVQNVTSIFTPEFSADPEVTATSAYGREIKCVGVKKGNETVGFLLWFPDRRPEGNLERASVSLTINGVTLEKPVYVDLMSGNVQDLARCISRGGNVDDIVRLNEFPMWDCPVLVINKSAINYK